MTRRLALACSFALTVAVSFVVVASGMGSGGSNEPAQAVEPSEAAVATAPPTILEGVVFMDVPLSKVAQQVASGGSSGSSGADSDLLTLHVRREDGDDNGGLAFAGDGDDDGNAHGFTDTGTDGFTDTGTDGFTDTGSDGFTDTGSDGFTDTGSDG